jgi:hypothetical protein
MECSLVNPDFSVPPAHPVHPVHPVRAAIETMAAALKDVVDVDPTFMTVADKKTALIALAGLGARLEELQLRVLATAEDVAHDEGARDAAAWLAHHTRIDGAQAAGSCGSPTPWTTASAGSATRWPRGR